MLVHQGAALPHVQAEVQSASFCCLRICRILKKHRVHQSLQDSSAPCSSAPAASTAGRCSTARNACEGEQGGAAL